MWSNNIKCKYMFMFPMKNLARKGLKWLILPQIKACRLVGIKPSPEAMLTSCQLHPWEHTCVKFESKRLIHSLIEIHLKVSGNVSHFVQASMY